MATTPFNENATVDNGAIQTNGGTTTTAATAPVSSTTAPVVPVASTTPKTLYDYYTGKGQSLPSVADRASVAKDAGISNYTGTADQNNALLSHLMSKGTTTPPATNTTPTVPPPTVPPPATTPPPANTPSPATTPPPTTTPPDATNTPALADQTDRDALKKVQDDQQQAAQTFADTIQNIQNGTIPLSAGEQAQVNGLQLQFQQLIDQQKLDNTNASGVANIRGYQTGAAEYDPNFQLKTIGSIVTAGNNKIADLNIKMASAVAALTQSLKDNDISKIKDSYDALNTASDKRQAALQKTIDDTQKAIKDAQDAKIAADKVAYDTKVAADKVTYDTLTKPIQDIATDAAKNGADPQTLASISASKTVGDAVKNAGTYLQTGTGDVGEYIYYQNQAKNSGQPVLSYTDFLAYKQKIAGKGSGVAGDISSYDTATQDKLKSVGFDKFSSDAQGLASDLVDGRMAPSDLSKRSSGNASYSDVLNAADKYSMALYGKHFDIAKANRDYKFANNKSTLDTLNYLGSLAGSDDGSGNLVGGNLTELESISNSINRTQFPAINDARGWAKLATGDPQMAQFQAVAAEVADQVAKILQGGSGGTSDAKLQQATNLFNTGFTKEQLSAVIESLKPLLANRAKSMIKDNPYLSDYADQFGVEQSNKPKSAADSLVEDQKKAKDTVDSYIGSHPDKAASIAKLFLIKNPDGTPVNDMNVYEYMQLHPEVYGQLPSFSTEGSDSKTATKVKGYSQTTDLAKGIVAGYDIKSYATDPNHEKRVSAIYNQIGKVSSSQDADNVIKKLSPNSPLTGKDVMDAANAYGVDPSMIISIMQQDSSLGTAGKAVRTKNPGNVGNDDSGNTANMGTWRDGIFAVAKNLAGRKLQ